MQPYQQRVIDEKAELDSKLEKLIIFINGPTYTTLEQDEKVRLTRQGDVMREYSDILHERIKAFF